LSERFGGWLDLPSEAACCDEVEGLTNRLVASDDIREEWNIGTVSEVDGRASRDSRGSDLVDSNLAAGNNTTGLDVGSDGGRGGGGGGSVGGGGINCKGKGDTGIAGSCGGLPEVRLSVNQGEHEVSILEMVLLLPCRLPFPLSFSVGVFVSLSLSGLGCSVDLLPKDIRLTPPINTFLPSVPSSLSLSFPLCLSLETDRTMR